MGGDGGWWMKVAAVNTDDEQKQVAGDLWNRGDSDVGGCNRTWWKHGGSDSVTKAAEVDG